MGAKSLCIPFEQPTGDEAIKPGETKCPQCGQDAKVSELSEYGLALAITNIFTNVALLLVWSVLLDVLFIRKGVAAVETAGLLINIHISSVDINH